MATVRRRYGDQVWGAGVGCRRGLQVRGADVCCRCEDYRCEEYRHGEQAWGDTQAVRRHKHIPAMNFQPGRSAAICLCPEPCAGAEGHL